ncbi:MAG: HAD family hydrolase [Planctomycetota bacterium]
MPSAPPFDAVLFDLDGTLVATDRFWVQAARIGARRAFDELALERALPSTAEWMGLVGLPLEQGFDALFSDLDPSARRHLEAACVAEEHRLLEAGGAALMPGAAEALDALKASGARLAVASNCSQAYLDHMWEALGLARWMEAARCLASPGVLDKGDMLEQLLGLFGTRSAVMVGDRATDGAAAAANGLPFVFCRFGFAPEGEWLAPGGSIDDFGALGTQLDARTEALDRMLDTIGARRATFLPPAVLGVAGPPGSGATLLARDLARRLDAAFLPLACYQAATFDLAAFEREVLVPRARGERVVVRRECADAGGVPETVEVDVPPDRALVLESPALFDPSLSSRLDRLLVVEVADDVALGRLAGRDARRYGPGSLEPARRRLAAWRELTARVAPARVADLVVGLDNVLAPRLS